MGNELTGAMLTELYNTAWHETAVISVDAGGWHRIEPAPDAEAAGRRIVITQDELDIRCAAAAFDGFDRIAARLRGEKP